MSDFLELCARRQSCRRFVSKPVEREKLVRCIEAARLSPSACNSQPWSFVVVETEQTVQEVTKATYSNLSTAQAYIVILEEHAELMEYVKPLVRKQHFAKGDLGAAAVTICYEAEEQGLGSCILGLYDKEKLCRLLDIPAEKEFALLIALGYPADPALRPKSRKSVEQIARFV